MQQVVIDRGDSDFYLTLEQLSRYLELKGIEYRVNQHGIIETREPVGIWPDTRQSDHYWIVFTEDEIERDDPCLVQLVQEMNDADPQCNYKVVDIPDGVDYEITKHYDSDGHYTEYAEEVHRVWY